LLVRSARAASAVARAAKLSVAQVVLNAPLLLLSLLPSRVFERDSSSYGQSLIARSNAVRAAHPAQRAARGGGDECPPAAMARCRRARSGSAGASRKTTAVGQHLHPALPAALMPAGPQARPTASTQ
jgi:hypothetical protein